MPALMMWSGFILRLIKKDGRIDITLIPLKKKKPERDLKREKKTAAQLKKYGFVLTYDEYYGYSIEDSLGYTMEHCKNIKKAEEIAEKLKKKGFKERESPVKQRKILHEFEEKITCYHDIWVKIGFDWKSTEHNKGYMIVDRDKTLLGEKYSLTLDDIAAYIKKKGVKFGKEKILYGISFGKMGIY